MEAEHNPTLQALVRHETGKGAARKLRAQGLIPGVCYGTGTENIIVSMDPKEFNKVLNAPLRLNTVFKVAIDGGSTINNVMLREYQVDPVSRALEHADLIVVDMNKPVVVTVPIESTGRAKGVRMGGRLTAIRREVKVQCRPGEIPESVMVDVTELGPGDTIMASEMSFPEGVEPAFKDDFAVMRIAMPRKVAEKAVDPKAKKKKA